MTDLPVLPDATVDAAVQGSYCPKLCTFTCPVHAATGRDDAVPWGFHRAVTDLADGRRGPQDVADDVVACTGCLACRTACTFEQDVPAQVRAARAVATPRTAAATATLEHLAAGRRPDGTTGPVDQVRAGATVLHAGCQDPDEVVAAARVLLEAAGHEVAVVGDGCCGQLGRDLGATDTADARVDHRAVQLDGAGLVVALDPHCRPSLPDTVPVRDLWSVLAEADLPFTAEAGPSVTYHDPCLLARDARVVDPPRALLAAAGYRIVEPEFHGRDTACAGAGMALPLLDPAAADATARRRADHLTAARADVTATACSRAGASLRDAGHPTRDLAVLLAGRLTETR